MAARRAGIAALDARLGELAPQRAELGQEQGRLEDELAAITGKRTEVEKRLYSGTVGSPRELRAMQADVEALKRRVSVLEDQLLEVMQAREPLDQDAERLGAERATLDAQAAELQEAVDEAGAGIDAELAVEVAARDQLALGLPAPVLSMYERLRSQLGGVGAARLDHGACGGCHLALPATELDDIRRQPPDAVVRCENCGRILVR